MKSIQELIDAALVPVERVRSGKFNPSSLGYCYRAQWWNRKNEPKSEPPDERSRRVMFAGKTYHDVIQGLIIKDSNNDCQTEVKIETDDFLGYADIVRGNEVIDIKAVHSKSFWYMEKTNVDIKKEKYGNWLQVMWYAVQLKKEFARLCFVSRDDWCIAEYPEPVAGYWTDEVNKEVAALKKIWSDGVLPPAKPRCEPKVDKKTKEVTYWQCTYCSFLSLCKKTELERKANDPTKI